ncbi:MAG: hypothetical protein IJ468_11510 [Lachnospiraceae bacterium]|nr:hypothetical protein [Lachnospiraceae bacterium]
MSSRTKIVVFKMKELIYTVIFIGLAVLLIVLLILMFRPKGNDSSPSSPSAQTETTYIPGTYTTAMRLSDQTLNLVICVDANHINSISLENLEETIETLYPLIPSALQSLSTQILATQSLDGVTYSPSSQYTSELLLGVISETLQKALAVQNDSQSPL